MYSLALDTPYYQLTNVHYSLDVILKLTSNITTNKIKNVLAVIMHADVIHIIKNLISVLIQLVKMTSIGYFMVFICVNV